MMSAPSKYRVCTTDYLPTTHVTPHRVKELMFILDNILRMTYASLGQGEANLKAKVCEQSLVMRCVMHCVDLHKPIKW